MSEAAWRAWEQEVPAGVGDCPVCDGGEGEPCGEDCAETMARAEATRQARRWVLAARAAIGFARIYRVHGEPVDGERLRPIIDRIRFCRAEASAARRRARGGS